MRYTLALTERAEVDIANAKKWYESERPGRGDRFESAVHAVLGRLTELPDSGAPSRLGLRRVTLVRFPYTVYYRVIGSVIEVRACVHHRRRPISTRRRYFRESLVGVDAATATPATAHPRQLLLKGQVLVVEELRGLTMLFFVGEVVEHRADIGLAT